MAGHLGASTEAQGYLGRSRALALKKREIQCNMRPLVFARPWGLLS